MSPKSSSSLFGLSSGEDQGGFQPRPGQFALLEWMKRKPKDRLVVQWPTGYGKSFGIALAYKAMRDRGAANRLLIIVANDLQRKQLERDFQADCRTIGLDIPKPHCFRNEGVTPRMNREGEAEVFIATVQMVSSTGRPKTSEPFIDTMLNLLLDHGSWMIAIDEFHHSASDRDWGLAISRLLEAAIFVLAMSATPYRTLGKTLFGKPDLVVTYQEASRETLAKKMIRHMYHYQVDTLSKEKEPVSYDTEQLRTLIGTENIDVYEERHELRYTPKYVWPVLTNPLARLEDTRMAWMEAGVDLPPQMLIRAMSCRHARALTVQIKTMVGDGITVEWVGTGVNGRTDEDNGRIISLFCPPKDPQTGKRERPSIDILVQVAMAGEGMDSVPVTEIVDLSLTRCTPPANMDKQLYGRGARVIPGLPKHLQICHINVPTDHPLSGYGDLLDTWFDDQPPENPDLTRQAKLREIKRAIDDLAIDGAIEVVDRHIGDLPELQSVRDALQDGDRGLALDRLEKLGDGDYQPQPLPKDPPQVRTVQLLNITSDDPHFRHFAEPAARKRGYDLEDPDDLKEVMHLFEAALQRKHEEMRKVMNLDQLRSAIDIATGKLSWRALRARKQTIEKSALGDMKRKINARIKREFGGERSSMTMKELEGIYSWCVDIEERMIAGNSPTWLL